ncbi:MULTISPECIES: hypothetical protein [Bacillus cereus group]|uniref:hypothetical protein n=1 Tax=Bacillus cereus group TaxID=86661 RepID=UPI0015595978|nr:MULTISPECIES: hypothetical protein [Bacillus cereus group]MBJ8024619.1 hypothetical protein [Bacillus cereus]MBJ8037380.1 hypothetical protein [Bacillus cereus]MED3322901.1 hypothetical protein [Bacillus thuringiensis]
MKLIIMSMQIAFLAMVSYSGVDEVKNINYDKKIQVAANHDIYKEQNTMVRMAVDPGTM